MIEEVVRVGQNESLVGILCGPRDRARSESEPVVLMFNAGFLHRVGPFRLWVDLGRALAADGVVSFRFDLNGLGDSAEARSGGEFTPIAIQNIREAMDELDRRMGPNEYVIVGLCSGADYGHPAMKADARIRGAVWIDAFGYRTPWFHVNRQLQRVLSPRRWKNIIQKAMRKEAEIRDLLDEGVREFPPKSETQADLMKFESEGRRLFFIYTAGVPEYFNYERQFWRMFPKLRPGPAIRYRFYPETDHTFSLVNERRQVLAEITRFITEKKPGPGP